VVGGEEGRDFHLGFLASRFGRSRTEQAYHYQDLLSFKLARRFASHMYDRYILCRG